jgi:hypothetical protein
MTQEELREANPLMVLLQSFMPWFNAGQAPDYAADDPPPPPEGQA